MLHIIQLPRSLRGNPSASLRDEWENPHSLARPAYTQNRAFLQLIITKNDPGSMGKAGVKPDKRCLYAFIRQADDQ